MIRVGDCLEVMRTLDAASVDSIVTDPPYGLGFMGKAWDHAVPGAPFWTEMLRVAKPGAYLVAFGGTRTFHRMACAIEDAGWELRDTLMYVYGSGFPKSHNLDREMGHAFCGCATSDDSVRGVRQEPNDAGSMAPQGEAPDLFSSMQREASGGSDQGAQELRPPRPEPEAAGVEQPGVEGRGHDEAAEGQLLGREVRQGARVGEADGAGGRLHHGTPARDGADLRVPADADGSGGPSGPQPVEQSPVEPGAVPDQRGPQAGGAWPLCSGCGKPRVPRGLGTALKPAWEPIILARKPLDGTVAANVREHGTGALNIDGCRVEGVPPSVPQPKFIREMVAGFGASDGRNGERSQATGRWPANLIHDGSEEVLAAFPSAPGQQGDLTGNEPSRPVKNTYGEYAGRREFKARRDGEASADRRYTEEGATNFAPLPGMRRDPTSAARFFYCAKASKRDRGEDNRHPTVKPTDLMRWLCRLVTPAGGLVLDPFAGSGSTGRGAIAEGFQFTGIELDPDYARIAEARIRAVQPGLPLEATA